MANFKYDFQIEADSKLSADKKMEALATIAANFTEAELEKITMLIKHKKQQLKTFKTFIYTL